LGALIVLTLAGQTTVHPVALTLIVKLQVALFSDPSSAVQVTVLVPIGNLEPEAGVQLMVAFEQLSLAVGEA